MRDRDLLREYVLNQSERAFAELVERHIGLVYATAQRKLGESHLAKDITQMVFIQLAKKAATIREGDALSGWLYQVTCGVANGAMRSEHRRRQRETEAMNLAELENNLPSAWSAVAPLIDEAIQRLAPREQNAVVLRFFEGKSLREVGLALDLSDDAAQKRISRALEKMRAYLARHGVTAGVTLLASAIAAHSASAAPAGLAVSITGTALASGVGAGSAGIAGSWLKTILAHKIKVAIVSALCVSVLAAPMVRRSWAKPFGQSPVAAAISTANQIVALRDGATTGQPEALTFETPINATWNDAGSQFTLSSLQSSGKETITVHAEGTVRQVAEGYFLEYKISWQNFETTPAAPAGQPVVSKDNFEIQSSVTLPPNKPFSLMHANGKDIRLMTDGKKIILTITKQNGL